MGIRVACCFVGRWLNKTHIAWVCVNSGKFEMVGDHYNCSIFSLIAEIPKKKGKACGLAICMWWLGRLLTDGRVTWGLLARRWIAWEVVGRTVGPLLGLMVRWWSCDVAPNCWWIVFAQWLRLLIFVRSHFWHAFTQAFITSLGRVGVSLRLS